MDETMVRRFAVLKAATIKAYQSKRAGSYLKRVGEMQQTFITEHAPSKTAPRVKGDRRNGASAPIGSPYACVGSAVDSGCSAIDADTLDGIFGKSMAALKAAPIREYTSK